VPITNYEAGDFTRMTAVIADWLTDLPCGSGENRNEERRGCRPWPALSRSVITPPTTNGDRREYRSPPGEIHAVELRRHFIFGERRPSREL